MPLAPVDIPNAPVDILCRSQNDAPHARSLRSKASFGSRTIAATLLYSHVRHTLACVFCDDLSTTGGHTLNDRAVAKRGHCCLMAHCQLCGNSTLHPVWCPDCGALAHCGADHLNQHRRGAHDDEECARMKSQMQLGPRVRSLGLEFSELLAAEAPDEDHICFLLEVLGVHCCGLYASLCKCSNGTGPDTCAQIHSWPAYCSWRGIPLSSPSPLLLTWPLTLWHSVERLLSPKPPPLALSHDAGTTEEPTTLRILVAGAASVEVAQQSCLLELLHLWGAIKTILVALVGPDVAACEQGSIKVLDNGGNRKVKVACFSGYVHQEMEAVISFFEHGCRSPATSMPTKSSNTVRAAWRHCESEKFRHWPDLAFLPNAGLAAYTTWTETLELLATAQVPVVATDYCEDAMVRALSVTSLFQKSIHLNPFRSPMPMAQHGSRLPSYSNAFMCGPRLQCFCYVGIVQLRCEIKTICGMV